MSAGVAAARTVFAAAARSACAAAAVCSAGTADTACAARAAAVRSAGAAAAALAARASSTHGHGLYPFCSTTGRHEAVRGISPATIFRRRPGPLARPGRVCLPRRRYHHGRREVRPGRREPAAGGRSAGAGRGNCATGRLYGADRRTTQSAGPVPRRSPGRSSPPHPAG